MNVNCTAVAINKLLSEWMKNVLILKSYGTACFLKKQKHLLSLIYRAVADYYYALII